MVITVLTCKKDQTPVQNPTKDYVTYSSNEGIIGGGGGKITLSDINSAINGVSVDIPSGALQKEIKVSVQIDKTKHPTSDSLATIINLLPDGLVFSKPVVITIPLHNISNPKLFYYLSDSDAVEQVPITNIQSGYIQAEINHFSKYFVTEEDDATLVADLFNTTTGLKANIQFGALHNGKITLSWIPTNPILTGTCGNFNVRDVMNNCFNLFSSDLNGFHAHVKVTLITDGWLSQKRLKTIEYEVRRIVQNASNFSIRINQLSPQSKLVYESQNQNSDVREAFYDGKALIFDFGINPEAGKNYYLELTWYAAEDPTIEFKMTSKYTINTYSFPVVWTTTSIKTFDPDADRNLINDEYDLKIVKPTLTTNDGSNITQTTATSGGNISSDGGATVTARGVCWSKSADPTTELTTKTSDDTGTGAFTSSLTGLTANTIYYVRAYATNSEGTAYGVGISFTTLATVPGAPTIGSAAAGNAQATITFSAPVSNGGSAITAYTVKSNPGNIAGTGSTSPIAVTGLTNGIAYTFKVTATNAIGESIASSASNSVTPTTTSTVPGAPTIGTATAGNAQATITFTAPISNGGTAITGYTVTSSPGSKSSSGTASPITITGLANGTAYTFTVTAINAIGTSVASSASNSVTPTASVTTISDIDGNSYSIVSIGTQTWMAENLKTTKFNDGTAIPNVTVDATWAALTTGAYCDYSNTSSNSATYGRLYNWYVLDNNVSTEAASNGGKNVCPTDWHVPSDAEWSTLTSYLGGESVAGGKLKETGTTHWTTPNTGATNVQGFTGLPGGFRQGSYSLLGVLGIWWSTTPLSSTQAVSYGVYNSDPSLIRYNHDKLYGFSVRCIRDF